MPCKYLPSCNTRSALGGTETKRNQRGIKETKEEELAEVGAGQVQRALLPGLPSFRRWLELCRAHQEMVRAPKSPAGWLGTGHCSGVSFSFLCCEVDTNAFPAAS